MSKILIKNGNVWDGEKFVFADILIQNGLITKFQKNITESADYTYDATNKLVSPGLIDIHTHFLGEFGINAEMSCIPFGVTSAVDAGAPPNRIENYNNYLVKNKVFVSAVIKNNKFESADTLKLLEHYGKKALGIKVYLDTFVSDVINIEPLKEVCCYAKDNSLKVMVHTTNSPVSMSEIVSVLNKGDIITHAYHGGKNNASFNDFECLKTAKQKGVIIDTGFAGNVHTDFAVFKNAVKNGCLPDTISTDITKFSAYKRGGKYGMTMCMEIAKQSGMSEEAVFQSVTSNPAKVLGKEDEWGYISIGRCADVSVFTQNGNGFSLTDSQGNTVGNNKCYECVLTVCNGEIVYKA